MVNRESHLDYSILHRAIGRLAADLEPDGDPTFDAGVLWVALTPEIPMLIVMYHERASCYDDRGHQIRVAWRRFFHLPPWLPTRYTAHS